MIINIDTRLKYKLMALTSHEFEVAGWLTGDIKDNQIYIDEVIIPPQEASGASASMDSDSILWIIKNHKKDIKRIIGHWHSHCNFGTFYSGTDEDNHVEIMKGKKYFCFIVTSTKESELDFKARVIINEPFALEIDAKIREYGGDYAKIKEQMDKEVEKKVKKKEYGYTMSHGDYRDMDLYNYGYGYGYSNGNRRNGADYRNERCGEEEIEEGFSPEEGRCKEWVMNIEDINKEQVDIIYKALKTDRRFKYFEVHCYSHMDTDTSTLIYDVVIDCKKKKMFRKLKRLLCNEFGQTE